MQKDRGLDLWSLGTMVEAEVSAFRKSYENSHGQILSAYEFWLEFNPRVVKSHRLQAFTASSTDQRQLPLHGTLGFLHLYAVLGYEQGIRYEVSHARSLGASREAVLQTFEIAFIHGGPRAMDAVSNAATDLLREWTEDRDRGAAIFPAGWSPDAEIFQLTLDMGSEILSVVDFAAITSWYERIAGEVPSWVQFLERGRPALLKAYHDRVARAMQGPLPRQMLPFMQLQMHVARGNPAGARESALLGRGLGMSSDELYEAIAWGMLYCGASGISLISEGVGDVVT